MDGKVQYGIGLPQVRKPKGVAFMPASPTGHFRLVVADSGNNRLRLLEGTFGGLASPSSIDANMTTLAGSARDGFHNGAAAMATFNNPMGLAFTSDGGKLVAVDQRINSYLGNRRLRLLMTTLCGQGKTEGSEACDDGNTADSDGCSSFCAVEAGWTCNSECLTFCQGTKPSVCSAICGDGRNVTSEQCDDGNLANGDGCTNKCRVEFGWECSPAPRPPSPPSPPAPALTDVGNHAHLPFPSVERGRRRQKGGGWLRTAGWWQGVRRGQCARLFAVMGSCVGRRSVMTATGTTTTAAPLTAASRRRWASWCGTGAKGRGSLSRATSP